MKLREKVILTTFGLFMLEAIIHYNQGKKECDCDSPKPKKGFIPPTKSLVKLALVVGAFSVINGIVIKEIEG
jgi:hypothetical protein